MKDTLAFQSARYPKAEPIEEAPEQEAQDENQEERLTTLPTSTWPFPSYCTYVPDIVPDDRESQRSSMQPEGTQQPMGH